MSNVSIYDSYTMQQISFNVGYLNEDFLKSQVKVENPDNFLDIPYSSESTENAQSYFLPERSTLLCRRTGLIMQGWQMSIWTLPKQQWTPDTEWMNWK